MLSTCSEMAFAHFFRSYDYALRNTGNKIAALTSSCCSGSIGKAEAILILMSSAVGSPISKLYLRFDVGHDGFIHLVAAHAHGPGIDNAGKGDDSDFPLCLHQYRRPYCLSAPE